MTSEYRARQIFDAGEFLDFSKDFRSTEPYATQVIGSTATAVVTGTASYASRKWWVVESEEDVVGIAMHTAPFNVFLSPMPKEAALVLADVIVGEDNDFPGVIAPNEISEVFVNQLLKSSPVPITANLYQEHLSYLLGELVMPDQIIGTARIATDSDFNLLLEWFSSFANEAGVESHDLDVTVRRGIEGKRLYLWINDGQIVSMAGFTKGIAFPGGFLCRVGPVYTPPEFRKRGYASFITASICKLLQGQGQTVMLYADAKNRDSNGIYTKIGFNLVGGNSIWKVTRI